MNECARMALLNPDTNPIQGSVRWCPSKSLWFTCMAALGISGVVWAPSVSAWAVTGALAALTLCCGHTVGLHRLLIHRSFACPRWLEYSLVHLGTLVGMGGPFNMLWFHDMRDWSQRQPACHAFFIHRNRIWKDFWWQLHCEIRLQHPPQFTIEPRVANDRMYRWLQRTWRWQQLPYAALLYWLGGFGWAAAGIGGRVALSLAGHWFINYFAHNAGRRTWHLEGHVVQGYNLPLLGLITMGENWHNNHHAFPGSARLGFQGQSDPGWWFIQLLKVLGLAWDIKTPENLPERPERKLLPRNSR